MRKLYICLHKTKMKTKILKLLNINKVMISKIYTILISNAKGKIETQSIINLLIRKNTEDTLHF